MLLWTRSHDAHVLTAARYRSPSPHRGVQTLYKSYEGFKNCARILNLDTQRNKLPSCSGVLKFPERFSRPRSQPIWELTNLETPGNITHQAHSRSTTPVGTRRARRDVLIRSSSGGRGSSQQRYIVRYHPPSTMNSSYFLL